MNLKKYLLLGGVALGLGMTSCVGDLDLEPNDPNLVNTNDPNFKANSLAICYSGIAVSGISGPGSSYVGGLDPGTSAYLRLIFTLNEFPTDELVWIWADAGVPDLVACTWSANNGLLQGMYYRLMGHIAICNQFMANTADEADAETLEMRAQARVLRAYSYYNMMDLFGQVSFITEEAEVGEEPTQISRKEIFNWIESELKEIVDNKLISDKPVLGRVGLDGAEALLARLYLNAEVYTGTSRWADCQKHCENIIARHQNGGFVASTGEKTGLANHYFYLFSRDNDAYMPGGSNAAENEILFGICFDDQMTQSYGGPSFIIAGTMTTTPGFDGLSLGCSGTWACIKGTKQMAEKFYENSTDIRNDMWITGIREGEVYTDEFIGFTGEFTTCGGNGLVKFTGLNRNAAEDGGWNETVISTTFASTAQPVIRLADVYLMYTEAYVNGNVGDREKALKYVNFVRERAKAPRFGYSDLTRRNIVDERAREFYLESTRRPDLIRNGYFSGPSQLVWQCKGNIDDMQGTRIDSKYDLFPIPTAVLSASPDFKQNTGY